MIYPMNTYAPSIIKSLGFSGLQANGMNSVGSVGALVFAISLAYSSDRFQERGIHVSAGFLVGAVGLLWLALPPTGGSKWVLYGKCPCRFSRPTKLTRPSWGSLYADWNGKCTRHPRRLDDIEDARA